jgi:hypothetical protein
VRAAEARDEYEDLESARNETRDEYRPIAQFDHTHHSHHTHQPPKTHQQQVGVYEGGPTYAEVAAAGTSSQNKSAPDAPPSYSAIVKGGKHSAILRLMADHKVQT